MSSPSGSLEHLAPRTSRSRKYGLAITLILIIVAIILIIVSIVRNEQRIVRLSDHQSVMLRKICEATVTHC